ncbi:MAG: phosphotransferase enzyme family protein [Rhodanobacteraceae bacterium]
MQSDTPPLDDTTRAAVCDAWALSARTTFARLGNGLIHLTLSVRDGARQFVLQRINTAIFRAPQTVLQNLQTVTAHLDRERAAGRYDYEVLELVPTSDGALSLKLGDTSWWRMLAFVPDTRTHEIALSADLAFEAARGFGAFARALGNLPEDAVGETIPGFHDPVQRYEHFLRAVAEDRLGRLGDCRDECDAATALGELIGRWRSLAVDLPLRIVHNDCKLNNILFDLADRAVCVIDLDTVMPGSPLFDFGDLVRTIVNPEPEDSTRVDRVAVRHDLFAAVARGYLEGSGSLLDDIERANLVFGARLVTGVLALRFLADHLDGDEYFRVERPRHNLDRARNQLALLSWLEADDAQLQALVHTPAGHDPHPAV